MHVDGRAVLHFLIVMSPNTSVAGCNGVRPKPGPARFAVPVDVVAALRAAADLVAGLAVRLLAGFIGGFVADFSADFVDDFAADFVADLPPPTGGSAAWVCAARASEAI